MARKLDVLRGHSAAEGRDCAAIEKTVLALRPVLDDTDAFLAEVEQYAALGVSEVQVMPDRYPVGFIEQLTGRVLPRLAGAG